MTPSLGNGRKPGASHCLLHGCCWLQFPAISRGRKGDGSRCGLGREETRLRPCPGAAAGLVVATLCDERRSCPSEGSGDAVTLFVKWAP